MNLYKILRYMPVDIVLLALQELLNNTIKDLTYIGIDNSPHMINDAKANHPSTTFSQHDLNLPYTFMNASVVISNLTIQFIHIKNREQQHMFVQMPTLQTQQWLRHAWSEQHISKQRKCKYEQVAE